jgi:hypothetical protein
MHLWHVHFVIYLSKHHHHYHYHSVVRFSPESDEPENSVNEVSLVSPEGVTARLDLGVQIISALAGTLLAHTHPSIFVVFTIHRKP